MSSLILHWCTGFCPILSHSTVAIVPSIVIPSLMAIALHRSRVTTSSIIMYDAYYHNMYVPRMTFREILSVTPQESLDVVIVIGINVFLTLGKNATSRVEPIVGKPVMKQAFSCTSMHFSLILRL